MAVKGAADMLADARAAVRNSASRRVIGPVICFLKMSPLALPRDTTLPALRQAGTAYECPAEREKLAYEAQDHWLGLFGRNLENFLCCYPALVHAQPMLLFLATVLEQLDLALEHVAKRDIHNARFGLMLTDIKAFPYLREKFPHQAALDKALGRSFGDKVKFAKVTGNMTGDLSQTIVIMHGFRNEVYHVGLQHEAILPSLAVFYFDVACGYLTTYKPPGVGWASNQKLPERAKKYFHGPASFPGGFGDFGNGCAALAKASGHDPTETVAVLANHFDEVVSDQDTCIDIIAGGIYKGQETTRDKAVINSQTWPLAFSEEGKAFARKHGWTGNRLQLVEWLGQTYPIKFRGDPIPSWQRRATKLRSEKNPHAALRLYHSFMSDTAELRDALMESAGAVEAEIDAAIDRARGK
jgi:hypothetical protein